jgi:hypothetical protein
MVLRLLSNPIVSREGIESRSIPGPSLEGSTIEEGVDIQIEFLRDIVNLKVSRRLSLYCSNSKICLLIVSTNICFY